MADVIVNFKIMPADSSVDIGKLEAEIRSKIKTNQVDKEPMAFGLFALRVTVVVEDSEGATDKIEESIRAVNGVGEVEVLSVSRAL